MPSKPMVAANGWVTCSATTSAPIDRAKLTPALAAWADRGEPSVGIRIFLNMNLPPCGRRMLAAREVAAGPVRPAAPWPHDTARYTSYRYDSRPARLAAVCPRSEERRVGQ